MLTEIRPRVVFERMYSIQLTIRKLGLKRTAIYQYMNRGTLRFHMEGAHRKIAGHEIDRFWSYMRDRQVGISC